MRAFLSLYLFLCVSLEFCIFLRKVEDSTCYVTARIYVPTNVFAVVKWADGFSGVPRISPVLGRTVSGSTFRWHLIFF